MKKYKLIIDGQQYKTKVVEYKGNYAKISVNGIDYEIDIEEEGRVKKDNGKKIEPSSAPSVTPPTGTKKEPVSTPAPKTGDVTAPIPGTILEIKVKPGDKVSAADVVIILEAMKMESEVHAGTDGKVEEIKVSKGDSVQENQVLIKIGA